MQRRTSSPRDGSAREVTPMMMRSPDEAATSFAALHAPLCVLKGACRCSQMETPLQASAAVAVICSMTSEQHHTLSSRQNKFDTRCLVIVHVFSRKKACIGIRTAMSDYEIVQRAHRFDAILNSQRAPLPARHIDKHDSGRRRRAPLRLLDSRLVICWDSKRGASHAVRRLQRVHLPHHHTRHLCMDTCRGDVQPSDKRQLESWNVRCGNCSRASHGL